MNAMKDKKQKKEKKGKKEMKPSISEPRIVTTTKMLLRTSANDNLSFSSSDNNENENDNVNHHCEYKKRSKSSGYLLTLYNTHQLEDIQNKFLGSIEDV